MKKTTTRKVHYQTYIVSEQWRSQHPKWIKAVGSRCTLFPWIPIGKGKPYAIHHLHYRNLGNERLGRDVLPLSKFAHEKIIHGLLSGWRSAGQQKSYPNVLQQIVHGWMRQRLWVKKFLWMSLCVGLVLRYFCTL